MGGYTLPVVLTIRGIILVLDSLASSRRIAAGGNSQMHETRLHSLFFHPIARIVMRGFQE